MVVDFFLVIGIMKKESIIQWKSRFYEPYSVSINVQTKLGDRELLYTNSNNYYPGGGITNNGKISGMRWEENLLLEKMGWGAGRLILGASLFTFWENSQPGGF